MGVQRKRAYEPPADGDGYRVLVDRLWPRGVRKEALALDAWLKQLAPSDELRRWYGHEVARWPEFEQRYREELAASGEAQAALDAAIAALGPEVSRDEAARLLELARLANELRGLARPGGGSGAPPAR